MLDKSRLQQIFEDLVHIDAVSTNEQPMVDFVVDFFAKYDIAGEVDDHKNILFKISGTGDPLFLNAHIDTVEPTAGIVLKEHDGVITTDETTILGGDDRAGVAAILECVTHLIEVAVEHRPLEILFTAQEEIGLIGARHFDYSKLTATEGITLDSDGPASNIITASVGYVSIVGEIIGKAAHAAKPEEGVHAIYAASEFIQSIPCGKCTEETLVNVGVLNGGVASNAVPESVHLTCEVRSRNQQELDEHTTNIKEQLALVHKKHGTTDTIAFTQQFAPFAMDESHPWLQHVIAGVRSIGLIPEPQKSLGGMDANIFNENGIAVVTVGCGYRNMHSKQESVNLAELFDATRLLEQLVVREAVS